MLRRIVEGTGVLFMVLSMCACVFELGYAAHAWLSGYADVSLDALQMQGALAIVGIIAMFFGGVAILFSYDYFHPRNCRKNHNSRYVGA